MGREFSFGVTRDGNIISKTRLFFVKIVQRNWSGGISDKFKESPLEVVCEEQFIGNEFSKQLTLEGVSSHGMCSMCARE